MREPIAAYSTGAIDPSALAQIGYRDSDGDGLLDPLDTTPSFQLDQLVPPAPGLRPLLSGRGWDEPLPSPSRQPRTINTITSFEYRVAGGPWQAAEPADGAFDSDDERFALTAPLYDGSYALELRAVNSAGNTSAIVSAGVTVSGIGPQPSYSVSGPAVSNSAQVELLLEAPAGTQAVQASSDPLFRDAAWQPYSEWQPYRLADHDGMQLVHVRFRDGNGRSSLAYQQRITLDRQPPTGSVQLLSGQQVRAEVSASDNLSGVEAMEVQVNSGAANWRPYSAELPLPADATSVRVRLRDAAGNVSPPIEASGGFEAHLPLVVR
jgi:hypothetical protein